MEKVSVNADVKKAIMENNDNLAGWAIDVLVNHLQEMESKQEQEDFLYDVSTHGCVSGIISTVIYTCDTDTLFKDNMDEILEFFDMYKDNYDFDIACALIKDNGITDFPTRAVWFVIEYVANEWLRLEFDN